MAPDELLVDVQTRAGLVLERSGHERGEQPLGSLAVWRITCLASTRASARSTGRRARGRSRTGRGRPRGGVTAPGRRARRGDPSPPAATSLPRRRRPRSTTPRSTGAPSGRAGRTRARTVPLHVDASSSTRSMTRRSAVRGSPGHGGARRREHLADRPAEAVAEVHERSTGSASAACPTRRAGPGLRAPNRRTARRRPRPRPTPTRGAGSEFDVPNTSTKESRIQRSGRPRWARCISGADRPRAIDRRSQTRRGRTPTATISADARSHESAWLGARRRPCRPSAARATRS